MLYPLQCLLVLVILLISEGFELKEINSNTVCFANYAGSSAIAEELRDALFQLKLCQLLHNCTKKSLFLKACNRCMTLKVTQGHCIIGAIR